MAPTRTARLLLALDGSIHSMRAAEYVAARAIRLTETEVTVIHVVQGPPLPHAVPCDADPTVTGIRLKLQAAGVPTALHVVPGDAATKIAEVARTEAFDEIVIGSRGLGAMEGIAIGSVAYKVAHLASVPVTIVPNPFGATELDLDDGGAVHRILLAVDGSKSAARATEHACALANAAIPVEVCLLNVQRPVASRQVQRYVSASAIEAYLGDEGRAALAGSAEALRESGIRTESVVRIGSPARTIVHEALERGCTRIVIGSRGLGAVAGLVLGSTALQVLHRSEIPVTLVK